MKKSLKLLTVFAILVTLISSVFASEMLDVSADSDICKFSDSYDESNTLPFIRMCDGRISVDTDVNKSGICLSSKGIEVTKNMSKIQIMTSGDTIRISGNVENAVLIAPKVIIDGSVTGTVTVISESLNLTENSTVSSEILGTVQDLKVAGKINGNVIMVAEKAEVEDTATINGSVRCVTSSVDISEKSTINGIVYLKTSENVNIPNNLKDFVKIDQIEEKEVEHKVSLPIIKIVISSLLMSALYLLISSKTKLFEKAEQKLQKSTSKVLLTGLISTFAYPVLLIIMVTLCIFCLTAVFVPVIIITSALLILSIALSVVITAIVCIRKIEASKYNSYIDTNIKKFIFSTVLFIVLYLLAYIPFVGTYITYLYTIINIGTIIVLLFFKNKNNQ